MFIANIEKLKQVAEDIYNITGILTSIYDNDFHLICSYPQMGSEFCCEIRREPILYRRCLECDRNGLCKSAETKKIHTYRCHMGLTESVSPLCDNGVVIGYIMFGQICDSEKARADIRRLLPEISEKHSLDSGTLEEGLRKIKIIDNETICSLARILEMCACYLYLKRIIEVRADSQSENLRNYINENLGGDLSVETLCNYLNVSKSSLYKTTKDIFPDGISCYIRDRRLETAVEILSERSNTVTVNEVSAMSGFNDANYFIKLFKDKYGMTPKKFRNSKCSEK